VNTRIPISARRLLVLLAAGGLSAALAGPAALAAAATQSPGSGTTVHFPGLAQVGALFDAADYTGADAAHFCTGTVIDSPAGDLVLTAAHCVAGASQGTYTPGQITFAPGYDEGPNARLGGVWSVQSIHLAPGYAADGDEEDDYALLVIAPKHGVDIQRMTGGLRLATARLPEQVAVEGYNDLEYDAAGNEPVICATQAFEETDDGLPWARFDCPNYQDGTSGGPWIAAGGKVVGVIGGYEQGGDSPDWSYSALFDADTLAFYRSVADTR
jgi:Trypsin-like peptidase domain